VLAIALVPTSMLVSVQATVATVAHGWPEHHLSHPRYVSESCTLQRFGGRKGNYSASLGWIQHTDGHGSWNICTDGITNTSVVYSVGISTDISFDLSLTRQVGMHILCLDPTISEAQFHKNCIMARASAAECARLHFVPFGLGVRDHLLPLYKAGWQMSTMVPGMPHFEARPWMIAPLLRLESLMAFGGHRHIDILKVDIEGGEFALFNETVPSWLRNAPPSQIAFEVHERLTQHGEAAAHNLRRMLSSCGYQERYRDSEGQSYLYVRTRPAGLDCAATRQANASEVPSPGSQDMTADPDSAAVWARVREWQHNHSHAHSDN